MASAYLHRGQAEVVLGEVKEGLADLKIAAGLDARFQTIYEDAAAEAGLPKKSPAAEDSFHKAWTTLLGKVGGSFNLFMGTMGALFVLFAGCVLWFAKEGSPASRVRSFFTRSSRIATVTTPIADVDGAGADGLEGRTVDGGKYRVVCMIGRGGMGTVYKAYDLALKRDVAIKCMNEALLPNERECARFVDEGRTVAKLRHPNIVAVHSLFKEGRRALIVFEHIEGDTLHHMLNESPGRRLEPRRALAILAQLAAAVDYAHGEGVIHRDLKPPNVMVFGDKVKVMDFGISRVVEHTQATKTSMIVGTPVYMAPEQCDGIVVRQSDIYALGIIAYETLTGILPFRDMGPMQLDKREGRFPAASALLPSLPAAVDVVFKKVLDPDPEKRHPRGRDFVEALDVALRQATPPGA
ncbi:MAG: serine/threonine protein kinase [Elusimicrobiota bacterium]|nr:MAG: serine/threonine protein kinase [Elusimicrobiota bacterium]